MNPDFILKPVLLGLSMGSFCLTTCFPFLAAFLGSENRAAKRNFFLLFVFMLGRLAGYLLFGFIFGYLGEIWQGLYLSLLADASLVLLSALLFVYMLKIEKINDKDCLAAQTQNQNAFIMGFLMGVNLCPPFLLSLNYVFTLHNAMLGVLFFFIFFLASSVYFLPMIFVGFVAKITELRKTARLAGMIASIVFFAYGLYSLGKHWVTFTKGGL